MLLGRVLAFASSSSSSCLPRALARLGPESRLLVPLVQGHRFLSSAKQADGASSGSSKARARKASKEEEEEEDEGNEDEQEGGSGSTLFDESFMPVRPQGLFSAPFVEFRTYDIKPEFYPDFLSLTNKYIHLRTAHSTLAGYFTTEIGGCNQVVHFWPYESLKQRQDVRTKLSQDKEWIETYIKPMRPMLARQSNSLLLPIKTFESLYVPPKDAGQGVFLLRTVPSHPSDSDKVVQDLSKSMEFVFSLSLDLLIS